MTFITESETFEKKREFWKSMLNQDQEITGSPLENHGAPLTLSRQVLLQQMLDKKTLSHHSSQLNKDFLKSIKYI